MAHIANQHIDFDRISAFLRSGSGHPSSPSIKELAQRRKLPYLVHFTFAGNLPGILEQGLLPRDFLDQYDTGHAVYVNDGKRLDNHRDSVSLSIAHPNDRMFFKYRQESARPDWVVLVLDISILWEKDCAFFSGNAASAHLRHLPLEMLQGPEALEAMFYDAPSRSADALDCCDPTDCQAEVMVFDRIENRYLHGVCFPHAREFAKASELIMDHNTNYAIVPEFFNARSYVRRGGFDIGR